MISIAEEVAAALALAGSGQADKTAVLLRDLAGRYPASLDVQLGFVRLALEEGDAAKALDLLAAVSARHPGQPAVARLFVTVYRAIGRPADALVASEALLEADPSDLPLRVGAAELAAGTGAVDRALAHLEAALRLAPDDAKVHVTVGLVLVSVGRVDRAVAAFERARRLDPRLPEAHFDLGQALLRLGDAEAALDPLATAYALVPNDPAVAGAYAGALAALERFGEADRIARRVLVLAPRDPEAHRVLAAIAVAQGSPDAGVARLAGLVRQSPDDPTALRALADMLVSTGRPEDALAVAARLARDRADPSGDALRREILCRLGRYGEAWAVPEGSAKPGALQAIDVDAALPAAELVVFARYLPRLVERHPGLRITGDHPLMPLVGRIVGPDRLAARDVGDPVSILALPGLLGLGDADVPGPTPYLAPDPDRLAAWREALAAIPRPHVGTLFVDGEAGFSADAARRALGSVARPISLVIGPGRRRLKAWPEALDGGLHIADPDDLMAAVAALDLVVASDSLALQFAGALGRPALAAFARQPPWYWAADAAGFARFHPTVRVIVRPPGGDRAAWIEVLAAAVGQSASRDAPDREDIGDRDGTLVLSTVTTLE